MPVKPKFTGGSVRYSKSARASTPIEAVAPLTKTVGINVKLSDRNGALVMGMDSTIQKVPGISGPPRTWRVRCDLGHVPLNSGTFSVSIIVCNEAHTFAQFDHAMTITVIEHDVFGWGKSLPGPRIWGPLYWAPKWEIGQEGE